jgi:hypothetical protein
MARAMLAPLAGLLPLALSVGAFAQAPATCARADFEAVVDDAGEALRQLTQKNSPQFQAKLRSLKEKRGWNSEQFMAEGTRFVRDDKIAALEERSTTLLAKINGAGGEAGTQATVDCKRLDSLKSDLAALVALQQEKWTYMFTNIEAELAK